MLFVLEEFQIATLGYESIMSAMMGCLDLLLKGSLQSLLPMASDLWIKDVIEILSSKSLEVSVYYIVPSIFLSFCSFFFCSISLLFSFFLYPIFYFRYLVVVNLPWLSVKLYWNVFLRYM